MKTTVKTYATFQNLTEPGGQDLGATFDRMAHVLSKSAKKERATIRFRIRSGEDGSEWGLKLEEQGCRVVTSASGQPDLEIITAAETWLEIAGGSLSPLEAFLGGRLRVRGDYRLGKRLLRALASSSTARFDLS